MVIRLESALLKPPSHIDGQKSALHVINVVLESLYEGLFTVYEAVWKIHYIDLYIFI